MAWSKLGLMILEALGVDNAQVHSVTVECDFTGNAQVNITTVQLGDEPIHTRWGLLSKWKADEEEA